MMRLRFTCPHDQNKNFCVKVIYKEGPRTCVKEMKVPTIRELHEQFQLQCKGRCCTADNTIIAISSRHPLSWENFKKIVHKATKYGAKVTFGGLTDECKIKCPPSVICTYSKYLLCADKTCLGYLKNTVVKTKDRYIRAELKEKLEKLAKDNGFTIDWSRCKAVRKCKFQPKNECMRQDSCHSKKMESCDFMKPSKRKSRDWSTDDSDVDWQDDCWDKPMRECDSSCDKPKKHRDSFEENCQECSIDECLDHKMKHRKPCEEEEVFCDPCDKPVKQVCDKKCDDEPRMKEKTCSDSKGWEPSDDWCDRMCDKIMERMRSRKGPKNHDKEECDDQEWDCDFEDDWQDDHDWDMDDRDCNDCDEWDQDWEDDDGCNDHEWECGGRHWDCEEDDDCEMPKKRGHRKGKNQGKRQSWCEKDSCEFDLDDWCDN